jgi:hypothetical protein
MKVPKMMIDYTLRFGIPIALCYYFWDPKSDDEIRRDVVRRPEESPGLHGANRTVPIELRC